MALLSLLDLVTDRWSGATAAHIAEEGAVVVVGLVGAGAIAVRLRAALRESRELAERLKVTEAEAARWRAEAADLLQGLGAALDRQFERWALSPAEKEVALLLLKGLSHKEIAEVRSITEATARQQARALYKKAGLSGRNDLAAFFLEDLLLPSGASSGPRSS